MSEGHSASITSASAAAPGFATSCTGMIMSYFSKENQCQAAPSGSSIGSPPIIDDPVIKKLFGDTTVDNKNDYAMIERMLKGEKVISPEAITPLSPFDVDEITRGADRIIKKVEVRRQSDDLNKGSTQQRGLRSRRGSMITKESSGTSSLASTDSKKRSFSVSTSQLRQSSVKKGVSKGNKKQKEKSPGNKLRKRENKSVATETLSPKPSSAPPVQLLPACNLCENNATVGNLGFAPCTAHGDCTINYCCNDASVEKAPSGPRDAQGAGRTGDPPSSKSLPTKNVVKRSYRKKSGKDGDRRRTSVCVEETATSEAVELLGGNSSRRAVTGSPSSLPVVFIPTGPRASVRQYRYAETRRPVSALPGQQPWPQLSPPFSPHPFCPVHSRQLYGGQAPFLPTYGSPPAATTQGPYDAGPQAWWQPTGMPGQPQLPPTGSEAPREPGLLQPSESSCAIRPYDSWDTRAQQQTYTVPASGQVSSWYAPQLQQQPEGGPFPPIGAPQSTPSAVVAAPGDYYGYYSSPGRRWPKAQAEQFPQPYFPEGPAFQNMRGGNQEDLQKFTADQYRKSPTSMRTYPWFQFPSIPEDLNSSMKWGHTVGEAPSAGFPSLTTAKKVAERRERKDEAFAWSSGKLKAHTRRPSRGLGELGEPRRRPSACSRTVNRRRSSTASDRERPHPAHSWGKTELKDEHKRQPECQRLEHQRKLSTAHDHEMPPVNTCKGRNELGELRRRSSAAHVDDRRSSIIDRQRNNQRRRSSAALRETVPVNRRRSTDIRRASTTGNEGIAVENRGHTVEKLQGLSSQRRHSPSLPHASSSGYAKCPHCHSVSARRADCPFARPHSVCSVCRPYNSASSVHRCRHRCHYAQSCDPHVRHKQCVAALLPPCRYREPSVMGHCHGHRQVAPSWAGRCSSLRASPVGSYEQVTTPIETRITNICSVTPPPSPAPPTVLPAELAMPAIFSVSPPQPPAPQTVLPTELVMSAAPGFSGFLPDLDGKQQCGEDVYILLPTPSGDKLYQARPLSPVIQLAKGKGVLDHEDGSGRLSVSGVNVGLREARTWESERHEALGIPLISPKTGDERRKPGRCSQGASISSISSYVRLQPGTQSGRQDVELQTRDDTRPASFRRKSSTNISHAEQIFFVPKEKDRLQPGTERGRQDIDLQQTRQDTQRASSRRKSCDNLSNAEEIILVPKEQDDPRKPSLKRTSLASVFLIVGADTAGELDRESQDILGKIGEQSLEATKQLWTVRQQRTLSMSVPGKQEPADMSKEKSSQRRSFSVTEVAALERESKTIESQREDGTDALFGEALAEEQAEQVEPENENNAKSSAAEHFADAKESANENTEPGEQHAGSAEAVAEVSEKDEGSKENETIAEVPQPQTVNQIPAAAPDAEFRKQTPVFYGQCSLYPEIRLAMLIGLVCLVWILVIFLITRPKNQEEYTTETTRTWTFSTTPYNPPFTLLTKSSSPSTVTEQQLDVYLCSTELCIREGERLRRHISRELSPCSNFYRYVCSSWEDAPAHDFGDGVATSVDTVVEEVLAGTLRDYILDERNSGVGFVRDLYKACVYPSGESVGVLRNDVFGTLPINTWPYNGSGLHTGDIWRMAGLLIRRYGIVSLLDVVVGVQRGRANRTVELMYPRYLYLNERPNFAALETLKQAVLEAAHQFGWINEAENLILQVVSVVKTLAEIRPEKGVPNVIVTKFGDLAEDYGHLRTFIKAVFEDDVGTNTTVVLRSFDVLAIQVQRVVLDEDIVVPFLNYLGFCVLVHLSPLLKPENSINLRRILAVKLGGRVLTADLDWLLCLRMIESVQPACLSKALVLQQSAAGTYAPTRIWLGRLEDQFYRNLGRVKWMTRRSVAAFAEMVFHVARFFVGSSSRSDLCPDRRFAGRKMNSSISMFIRAAGYYQLRRLHQIKESTRPREYGHIFDTQSRYNTAQQALYIPIGLLDVSQPVNNTLLVYQASRSAVRLYLGLLPFVYEHWNSNEDTVVTEVLSEQRSFRRLSRLSECLRRDWQEMPKDLYFFTNNVVQRASEVADPLLAHTTAVSLAYTAFKDLLSVERIWKVDFRLESLPDVTSEQLFFLYYALDNCERSDETYQAHQFHVWGRLPPEYRVNFPLRHLPQFAQAFGCSASEEQPQPMAAPNGRRCEAVDWKRPSGRTSGWWLTQRSDDANIRDGLLAYQVDVGSSTNATDDG